MITALLYGILVGFMLCLTLGTVFFSLIQNSIDHGFKTGILIASGVVLSDGILITLSLMGSSALPAIPNLKLYASILCSVLLIAIGIGNFIKKETKVIYPKTKVGNVLYFATTGFFLNVLNPINFIVWAAIATRLSTEKNYSLQLQIIFFIGAIISIFITQTSISYFASKLKNVFNEKNLLFIHRIIGLVFIGIAFKLIYEII
jgi:threonine/homoserine/homoserine lactone efflux protein